MTYQILNPETVISYVKSVRALADYFDDYDTLTVEEIGDGNVNYVYRIKHPATAKSIILKQAVPYLRVVGESFPLSRERMTIEIQALAVAKRHTPSLVPEVYHSDIAQSLVIMQDLADHLIVRGEMIKGVQFPKFAEHMADYMAQNLFHSSDLFMASDAKKDAVKQFCNSNLCKLTEDLVFTHPFEDNDSNSYNPQLPQSVIDKAQKDGKVKSAVAQMRYKFMNNAEALIHGDLHIGSIMANQQQTYVIDPEFAFYGPMGFDVGALLGNLYMCYFSHACQRHLQGQKSKLYRRWLLDTVAQIWLGFSDRFSTLWLAHEIKTNGHHWSYPGGEADLQQHIQQFLQTLLADSIGFAACKMMRRVLGLAKVADFADIEDLKVRADIETNIIEMASQMVIKRHQFDSILALNQFAVSIDNYED